ncbi:cell wall-active antibiotic response 4TMS protein YvqF [Luteococcus japonicus]|uniref:Cell wall-active antibiotic response 4TMS protein YvqF n=1 Tax=Luteococcus japonicus TaxID=33984 RepID=A0A3N1ZXE0_9ACTN|nr:DUF1707 domain-containing protein [Luteococcus japonicus]ROR55520.1 cell wall-active antibiotic response 4TMS protein YvqF [Luteococcus japonicus]
MSEASPVPRGVRVGDQDRQQAVDRLADGYQQGMLTLDEFTDRTERAWSATWTKDLQGLLEDLPLAQPPHSSQGLAPITHRPPAVRSDGATGLPMTFALMSGADRSGDWTAAGTHTAVAIMGGVSLDLREASFTQPETTIMAVAIMGGIEVIVPPHVRVRVHGLPVMGGFGSEGAVDPASLPTDAPLVVVKGVAVMGGVGIKRLGYDEEA